LLAIAGTSDIFNLSSSTFFQKIKTSWDLVIRLCEILIQHKTLQEIIDSKQEKFDVIITSAFFNDCVFGISYIFDIPVITMCSFGGTNWMDEWVGNPSPYAYLPQIFSDYGDRMTFWQRTLNTLSEIYIKLGRIFYVLPQHDAILRKYFNSSSIPSISILEKSTALILINQHFSISYPRPLMPNIVEIGGIHINSPKKLSDVSIFI
jgi:glucuronosyltransferase